MAIGAGVAVLLLPCTLMQHLETTRYTDVSGERCLSLDVPRFKFLLIAGELLCGYQASPAPCQPHSPSLEGIMDKLEWAHTQTQFHIVNLR